MNPHISINITSIENGFLVSTPPEPSTFKPRTEDEARAMAQPNMTYCPDHDSVCKVIGGIMVKPSIIR